MISGLLCNKKGYLKLGRNKRSTSWSLVYPKKLILRNFSFLQLLERIFGKKNFSSRSYPWFLGPAEGLWGRLVNFILVSKVKNVNKGLKIHLNPTLSCISILKLWLANKTGQLEFSNIIKKYILQYIYIQQSCTTFRNEF